MNWRLRLVRKGVGDYAALTPLVRDLAAAFPRDRVFVDGGPAAELLAGHPNVAAEPPAAATDVALDYAPGIDRAFVGGHGHYHTLARDAFAAATGVDVPAGPCRPHLVLAPEDQVRPDPAPYWVVLAGSRWDIPVKAWPLSHFAEVVRLTPGVRWKQCGRVFDGRFTERQRALPGAENLLGRTTLRQLVRLVAHADGVLCLTSLGYHLAAAFRKPCVVVMGGREPPALYAPPAGDWPTLVLLHTIGEYSCCQTTGCGRIFAAPAHASAYPPGTLCALPVADPDAGSVAACLADLRPEAVAGQVLRLNTAGAGAP